MRAAYPEHVTLDDAHRALFDRWDAEDPPDDWERERNRRIAERQGNANPFIP
jgi:deoxyribonuclease-1